MRGGDRAAQRHRGTPPRGARPAAVPHRARTVRSADGGRTTSRRWPRSRGSCVTAAPPMPRWAPARAGAPRSCRSTRCSRRPGLYEVELGIPVRDIVERLGGGLVDGELAGVLIGGPLAGILPPQPARHAARVRGAAVGRLRGRPRRCRRVRRRTRRFAELVHHVFRFGAFESCGKCTPCRRRRRRGSRISSTPRSRGRPSPPRAARLARRSSTPSPTPACAVTAPGWPRSRAASLTHYRHGAGSVPRLTIDGRAVAAGGGRHCPRCRAPIAGVDIPTVCADPRLAPSGACRVCVVTIDGQERPVAACTTPARDGMTVETNTPALIAAPTHPAGAARPRSWPPRRSQPSADEPFSRLLADHGLVGTPNRRSDPSLVDDSHPTDPRRPVALHLVLALRAHLRRGAGPVRLAHRAAEASTRRIVPDSGTTFADSSCVSCGACVDTCPSGALEDRSRGRCGTPRPAGPARPVPYCGVGCELLVGTRDETDRADHARARRAGQPWSPVRQGALRLRLRRVARSGRPSR